MDTIVVIKNEIGQTKMIFSAEEFLKACRAPMTQFLDDCVAEYNKTHNGAASIEVWRNARGKKVRIF